MLGLFCCWTLLSKMGINNDSRAMKLDFESILDIFQLDVWMDLFDSLLRVCLVRGMEKWEDEKL